MALISVQFQLDDQEPIPINLSAHLTLDDFKESAANIYNPIYSYSFICHGKTLSMNNESKF